MSSRGFAALAVAAGIALAGCGGDDEGGTVTTVVQTVAAESTPAETAAVTTETTTTEETASPGSTTPTPGGTTLKMGEPAVVKYEDSGNSGKTTLVEVTPSEIEKGSLDDFKNIDLDAEQKASTPYYVKVTVKNVGKADISGADPASYIDGLDDRNQEQGGVIFFGDFDRCPDGDPKSLKPGESYESCITFLVPGGGSIEGMRWIFFDEGNSKSNVDWKQ